MKPREFIAQTPRTQRAALRQRIAARLNVTEAAVRHWCNGTRDIPPEKIVAFSRATGWRVTPHEINALVYPNVGDALPPEVAGIVRAACLGAEGAAVWRPPGAGGGLGAPPAA